MSSTCDMGEVTVGQGLVCRTGTCYIGDIPVGQCPVLVI